MSSAQPAESRVQLVGIAKLEDLLDTSRTTIWRLLRAGEFPEPLFIGSRRAWRLTDIETWIEARASQPPKPSH